jgi:transcription-repair coupling factor (superfamily II helicase)
VILVRDAAADGGARTPDIVFPIRPPEAIDRDIKRLRRLVSDGIPTVILCDNVGQCERLDEILNDEAAAPTPAALTVGVVDGGFIVPGPRASEPGLRILTDHEIFRRERRIRRHRRYGSGTSLESITALKPGDYVVHLEHGVGIYRGIEQVFVRESTIEVAVIEYEGGDRLNVPLYRIDQVERYRSGSDVGSDAPPPRLHKLGGKRWAQQRDRTRAALQELTLELLDLYARRRVADKIPSFPDTTWQRQLESSFLFEDTPDQRKATAEVKADMESTRPMDRLLVGDVGYGKTEIAVRAAFKAVQSGRQVAVLVPTTILAEQHGRTFVERLADFPVVVKTLSRFQTPKETRATLAAIAEKKVDIVIGTHRLLSADVVFANLGLVIVDEEHRFGVKHKERLKQLKLETDVLTLTATPIPRTLHQSLAGLRDMTVIQTPPRDRSPVLTFVEPWDDGLIEEGIARELDRGGQLFFVHNRIETILAIADHVQRLAPRARVAVAHGQMRERDLEEAMRRFVAGEVDVLVSTMIVESGLDVPNANTMFVNRADHFGLAQLYQLRGRVGRSYRRAYCYLLVPDAVDVDAERRLQVLEHNTELGSGYRVALKDLEFRGAGNLLGSEQSGFVQAVGFELYLKMLDETVNRMIKGGGTPKLRPADVSMDVAAFLPDDYLPIQEAKLDVYRRLSTFTRTEEVEALREELRDRFGPLPPPVVAFLASALLRIGGGALGIEGILVRGEEARITFRDDAVPRLKGLTSAFHEVQFQAEVRRAHPLSLKLTRLGGASLLDGLVRVLRGATRDA